MDFDLDTLLRRLLNTQKEYVVEDREKYSCAMVAVFTASGEKYIKFAKFDNWEEKVSAYQAIVNEAKLREATLIVTVNHAYVAEEKLDPDSYEWGDLDDSNSSRSILLTASGPGMRSCSLRLGYAISPAGVIFEEPEYLDKVVLNLLPGWPETDHDAIM